jgi:hypothetical protein
MVSLRDQLQKLARALAITQLGETAAEKAKARGLEETSGRKPVAQLWKLAPRRGSKRRPGGKHRSRSLISLHGQRNLLEGIAAHETNGFRDVPIGMAVGIGASAEERADGSRGHSASSWPTGAASAPAPWRVRFLSLSSRVRGCSHWVNTTGETSAPTKLRGRSWAHHRASRTDARANHFSVFKSWFCSGVSSPQDPARASAPSTFAHSAASLRCILPRASLCESLSY